MNIISISANNIISNTKAPSFTSKGNKTRNENVSVSMDDVDRSALQNYLDVSSKINQALIDSMKHTEEEKCYIRPFPDDYYRI